MSLGSKYDEINDFYTLLNAFVNTHEGITTETKNRKKKVMQKVVHLCNDYLDAYKKSYDREKVKDEEKRGRDYKQFEIIDNRGQEPKSTKKEETDKKNLMKYKNHHGLNCLEKILSH